MYIRERSSIKLGGFRNTKHIVVISNQLFLMVLGHKAGLCHPTFECAVGASPLRDPKTSEYKPQIPGTRYR